MALKSTQKYTLELREKIDDGLRSTSALVQEQEKAKKEDVAVVEETTVAATTEKAIADETKKERRITVRLFEDYALELDKIAKRNRESLNRTINKAVADYIVRHS